MYKDQHDRIEGVAAFCREAREALGPSGSFRLRVVLDMAEIECALERERLTMAEENRLRERGGDQRLP